MHPMNAVALLLLLAAADPPTPPKQPPTHEALFLMDRVGSPAVSPDGKWVVVPVTEPAYDEKKEVAEPHRLRHRQAPRPPPPGREPLDLEGREQPRVLPRGARLDGTLAEVGPPHFRAAATGFFSVPIRPRVHRPPKR
jgi:hypothetical protein